MEDMRTVDMHHDTGIGIAFSMAIASYMRARIDNRDLVPGFGQMPANYSPGKACADHQNTHAKPYHHCDFAASHMIQPSMQ
jgi:hypothetical protein